MIGTAGCAPSSISGMVPPGLGVKRAPIWLSGSITRPIGRPDRLASPTKVAVIGWLATTELVDLLGIVVIIAGAVLGVVGLVKVFSGASQAE